MREIAPVVECHYRGEIRFVSGMRSTSTFLRYFQFPH